MSHKRQIHCRTQTGLWGRRHTRWRLASTSYSYQLWGSTYCDWEHST